MVRLGRPSRRMEPKLFPVRVTITSLLTLLVVLVALNAVGSLVLLRSPSISNPTTTDTPAVVKPSQLCFITSVFGPPDVTTDRPPDVSDWEDVHDVSFFVFTNRPDLEAPGGWQLLLQPDLPYQRYITQSRWGKFLSWKDPTIQQTCRVGFYMDGYVRPNATSVESFRTLSDQILVRGLAQVKHPKLGGLKGELQRIVIHGKDNVEHVNRTIQWLHKQPDFSWNCTLYENTFFGFDPKNVIFQQATTFFWDHYSLEEDSWRDQPLWCYVLDHYHYEPLRIPYSQGNYELFERDLERLGHGGHRYIRDEGSN